MGVHDIMYGVQDIMYGVQEIMYDVQDIMFSHYFLYCIIDNGLKMEEENPTISREYIEYDVVTDIKLVPMSRL